MRQLVFACLAAAFFIGCSDAKTIRPGKDNTEKEKSEDESRSSNDESSLGNWSEEDKDKLKQEWDKTFANWKEGLQRESEFDEADFDKESKKVVNCTLSVLENKFPSYAKYKKANDKDHFQSDPDLLNEMGNCTDRLMQKYNREGQ